MIRAFLKAETGNVALMTGLVFTLLAVGTGTAMDHARGTNARLALQRVVDSATLAAFTTTPDDQTAQTELIESAIAASEICQAVTCATPDIAFPEGQLRVYASADVPTTVMNAFGKSTIAIDATATAMSEIDPLQIAMVLDYSSSMEDNDKWKNMRKAGLAFVDHAIKRAEGEVDIGIVPFAYMVLSPMDGDYAYDMFNGEGTAGRSLSGCLMNRAYPAAVSNATPDTIDEATKWRLASFIDGSNPEAGGLPDMPDDYVEYECQEYADRSLFVRPLTDNLPSIRTALNDMKPASGTNIALAVDVGWHMLSDNAPYTEIAAAPDEANRVMILLSDGEQSIAVDGASGKSVEAGSDNVAEICEGMKLDGIEIFVIAFDVEEEDKALLSGCASKEPHFYDPKATDELEEVFTEIYRKISAGNARLTN